MKLATAILLVTLLTSDAALAEDYSVDFGAETQSGKDAGTLQCRLDQVCHAKMQALGLTISLDVSRGDPTEARVRLYADDLSCCYFANDRDTISVYLRQPVSPMPFFKGARARGNLFIENERAGTLYLRFHFRQPLGERVIVHPENPDSKNL